ncbi:RNA-directed DNA polymerase, eukaryota [Tanacetum coccineum]
MVNFFSKEDVVSKVSTSIFVTNFPDSFSAKDLFHTCKVYGHVVDSFIPVKKPKAFQRPSVNEPKPHVPNFSRGCKRTPDATRAFKGDFAKDRSFASVLEGGKASLSSDVNSSPTIVLDEDCLNTEELSCSLLGRVKEFSPLSNIKNALSVEGFSDIMIQYMGEFWILLDFSSPESKEAFLACQGVCSWFSTLRQASSDFVNVGRIMWVEVEEITFRGKVYWIRAKEVPGWVPEFLEDSDEESQLEEDKEMGDFRLRLRRSQGGNPVQFPVVIVLCPNSLIRFQECSCHLLNIRICRKEVRRFHFELLRGDDQSRPNHVSSSQFRFFIIVRGVLRLSTGVDTLLIVVYAPHDKGEKRLLWEYLTSVVKGWKGDVIMTGDFNEFGGVRFTWCHKSASRMSKLDRFFISDNVWNSFPNLSAITLDRYLSDHRPILLRESVVDYGPSPFKFYHHWLGVDGFRKFVEDTWNVAPGHNLNGVSNLMLKLKFLKSKIKEWNSTHSRSSKAALTGLMDVLHELDIEIDKGSGSDVTVAKRLEVVNSIMTLQRDHATESLQKAKVKWSVEGDENSRFFHGLLNKKRRQLSIRGVMKDGVWVDNPSQVKAEFLNHFTNRFSLLRRIVFTELLFSLYSTLTKMVDSGLGCLVEWKLKVPVWDCGTDKMQLYVHHFVPKIPDANLIKDFRPISLIGSLYKIITKILANRLVPVIGSIVHEEEDSKRLFLSSNLLWTRVIKAIHGEDGNIGRIVPKNRRSCWLTIVNELNILKDKGINFFDFIKLKVGDGNTIRFWKDKWNDIGVLKDVYPRIFALETDRDVSLRSKLEAPNVASSLRRRVRGGVEDSQLNAMLETVGQVTFVPQVDRTLAWRLEQDGSSSFPSKSTSWPGKLK